MSSCISARKYSWLDSKQWKLVGFFLECCTNGNTVSNTCIITKNRGKPWFNLTLIKMKLQTFFTLMDAASVKSLIPMFYSCINQERDQSRQHCMWPRAKWFPINLRGVYQYCDANLKAAAWPNKINSFNIQNLQGKMIKFWTKIFSWKYLIFIHLHENKYCKHSVACFMQTVIFRWLFLFVEITSKTNLDWIWFFCLFVCSKMTICPKYIPT